MLLVQERVDRRLWLTLGIGFLLAQHTGPECLVEARERNLTESGLGATPGGRRFVGKFRRDLASLRNDALGRADMVNEPNDCACSTASNLPVIDNSWFFDQPRCKLIQYDPMIMGIPALISGWPMRVPALATRWSDTRAI